MESKTGRQSSNVATKSSSSPQNKMRYYVFYPVTKSITLIDVDENVHVEEIVELAKRKFGLRVHGSGPAEASVVLSYNGFDLKPKWCLADVGIPSGAIIHCLYREQKAADLYVYCGFDKRVLKIFDSSITVDTKFGTVRQIIAKKLGLPLCTFCLETYTGTQRLYDDMRLTDYDIKPHDRVYLKVWHGYDKFIGACVKGLSEWTPADDLTRYFKAQVALHIGAFYGHLELSEFALRQGARADRPVGEPPSRQWSSGTTVEMFPEVLRCPIHIAIERRHVILVDVFVRHSILCTQTRDPLTDALPYRLALSFSAQAKTEEAKQAYRSIYFSLYNKQYYLKIPLNATGEYISNLLTSTSNMIAVHRPLPSHVNVSLPMYCRIIRWCERARERTWKRFGGQCSTAQMKRVFPETGLLGYKVLIDGFNNIFEVPTEQLRLNRPSAGQRADPSKRYSTLTEEEQQKLEEVKARMKKIAPDERARFKQAMAHMHHERRSTVVQADIVALLRKNLGNGPHETPGLKTLRSTVEAAHPPAPNHTVSTSSTPGTKGPSVAKARLQRIFPQSEPTSRLSGHNNLNKPNLPPIISSMSNPTPSHSSLSVHAESTISNNGQSSPSVMSAADAYVYSKSLVAREIEEQNEKKRQAMFAQIEQAVKESQSKLPSAQSSERPVQSPYRLVQSLPTERGTMIDLDQCLPLPEHPVNLGASPVRSRHDRELRESVFRSYERYASASTRSTAVNCLQEANHFKRKPWMKQVGISKEMIKHKVHRRMGRAEAVGRKSAAAPLSDSTTQKSKPVEVI